MYKYDQIFGFLDQNMPQLAPNSALFCPDSLGMFLRVLIPEIYDQIIGFFDQIMPNLVRIRRCFVQIP